MIDYNFINIYGAGIVAYNAAIAIDDLEGPAKRRFFVSDEKDCAGFGGIRGECFDAHNIGKNEKVLIATPPQYHNEIEKLLTDKGISKENIFCLDPYNEYRLLGGYFKKNYGFNLADDYAIAKLKTEAPDFKYDVRVFMAKHVKDRTLTGNYKIPDWIIPVQAGAALSDEKIAEISDDFPGGISDRNGNYSELSVTYWAWKNSNADYIGICHYRRVFGIADNELKGLIESDAELIVTLPYMCSNSAKEQYFRYVSKSDYEVFIMCLEKIYGNDVSWEAILKALDNKYVYNYNMLIARRDIYDEYCRFIFPVLFEMEKHFEGLNVVRNDRYLGYFGEILSSVYLILNTGKYRTVYVPRIWLT